MTVRWVGGTSTDSTVPSNWSSGSVPAAGDDVVFDATSSGNDNCIINSATFPEDGGDLNSLTISSDFREIIQTGTNTEVNLEGVMTINNTACIDADHTLTFDFNAAPSTTVYDSGGSSYTYKPFVIFNSDMTDSVFVDNDSRTSTTFDFGSQDFTMIDGVYPNITGTGNLYAKSIYSDTSRGLHNTYGSVDMLAINGISVSSLSYDIYDYDKEFYFEGALTAIGDTFKFGHTTARLKAQGTGNKLPVNGELNSNAYGNDSAKTLYVEYHKIVIENGGSSNYWIISAGLTLDCNELVINDGGRLYGPSSGTKAATIKTVKRPTVQGDWNFRQITDGIYESINDFSNLSVYYGGTGLQTIPVGSILYGNGNGTIELLPIGSVGQVLTVYDSGGGVLKPRWETP